jgi:hypothetical protein
VKAEVKARGAFRFDGLTSSVEERMMLESLIHYSSAWWTGYADGKVVCVWGIIPCSVISDRGYLWLQVNDMVGYHRVAFARGAREVISEILRHYSMVFGHVDPNGCAWRFLQFLGASLGPLDRGLPTFEIRRP